MQGLQSAVGMVQRMVARELSIRQCPHLSFHLDETIKRTAETIRIINETMAEYERPATESDSRPPQPSDAGEDETVDQAGESDAV